MSQPPQYQSPQDVSYLMWRLYWHDLQEALATLRNLRRHRRDDVRFCLLRDFTVSYARPFSVNRAPLIRNHHLTLRVVPADMRALHSELMRLRSSVFAHTDFEFHRPRIARWVTKNGPIYPMALSTATYPELLKREPELRALATAVQVGIGALQKKWEEAFEARKQGPAA